MVWSSMASGVVLAGCSTSTMIVGQRFPPREDHCTVDFAYEKPSGDEYRTLAIISASNFIPPTLTPSLEETLRAKACRLGGDLVVMEQFNEGDLGRVDDSATFGVYRRAIGAK